MTISAFTRLLRRAYNDWQKDRAPLLGAALAYYTVFSLAPLVLIAISVAGVIFGDEAAQGVIVSEIGGTVGVEAAKGIEDIIRHARDGGSNLLGQIIGGLALAVGASGVFGQLQEAMNIIWKVDARTYKGVLGFLRDRFLSFALVCGTLFLLLVSLLVSAAISSLAGFFSGSIESLFHAIDIAVSLTVTTALFALLFKVLPDAKVKWRDVWLAACITSLLFMMGKFLLGLYIGKAAVASAFGAAGSLVVILLWVYYAAQILLFGAEIAYNRNKESANN